jgi:NodT family efflux transporter outer membrane factor (OMF) lipoprotein
MDRHSSGWRRLTKLLPLVLTLMSGCAVGPDFVAPSAPDTTGFTPERLSATAAAKSSGGQSQIFVEDLDIPGQWWSTFRSHQLNDLIQIAMQQNPDLQAAQASLHNARENAVAQRGLFYPQVGSLFNPTAGKIGQDVASPLASNAVYYSLNTAQLSVGYSPDVFGLNQRQTESLEALAEMQRYQLEAVYLTLTSNVVAAAVQEASLRGQIAATKKIVSIETELLTLLRQQKDLGQISNADVLAQEAALAQAQETLPPLEKQLALQRDLLTALAGQFPQNQVPQKFEFASFHLPRDLPVSLPSKLVEHRPDVKAAEANLHSASAAIGVAVANRLPVLNLTADLGASAANISRLFAPPTLFYTLAGSVAESIFDGGSLLHKQRAAQAAYEQADAQYRSTVITAFQNVADCLRAIQADARTLKAATYAETAAFKSLELTRQQLHLGQINNLTLLNAQQTYLQAAITRVQAQANRYADTAALFQALGGGWWNRNDVSASAEANSDIIGIK